MRQVANGGKPIVLTAPLTETIDHTGFLPQMGAPAPGRHLQFEVPPPERGVYHDPASKARPAAGREVDFTCGDDVEQLIEYSKQKQK
jgi:hypothetical protein